MDKKHRSSNTAESSPKRPRLDDDKEVSESIVNDNKSKSSVSKSDKNYDSSSGEQKNHLLQDQSNLGKKFLVNNNFENCLKL